jgi:hypothetical protein
MMKEGESRGGMCTAEKLEKNNIRVTQGGLIVPLLSYKELKTRGELRQELMLEDC